MFAISTCEFAFSSVLFLTSSPPFHCAKIAHIKTLENATFIVKSLHLEFGGNGNVFCTALSVECINGKFPKGS
jgi:hypothetical protein